MLEAQKLNRFQCLTANITVIYPKTNKLTRTKNPARENKVRSIAMETLTVTETIPEQKFIVKEEETSNNK